MPGVLPTGVDNAVGFSAHATGALIGVGVSFGFGKIKSDRAPAPAPITKERRASPRFDLKKVVDLIDRGEDDDAFIMLHCEVEGSARNRDAVKLYWEMCLEREEPDRAAEALVRLLKEELRRGASREAAAHWRTLTDKLPNYRIDVPTLIQLAPTIGQAEGEEGALQLLEQCVDNDGLTGALAHKVANWCVELNPKMARAAARKALDSSELKDGARDELKMLLKALAPDHKESNGETKAPAPSIFFEESDRSDFGEVSDLTEMMSQTFPDGVLCQAAPIGIEDDVIVIRPYDTEEEKRIDYKRIRGIFAVGVRGLSDKPVVVIDLLIDGGGETLPLSVIRLRGDQFDPRTLIEDSTSVREAIHEVVVKIQSNTYARTFADVTSQPPRPKIIFEGLDEYHEKILRPAAELLA
jgi:hypothetical protein